LSLKILRVTIYGAAIFVVLFSLLSLYWLLVRLSDALILAGSRYVAQVAEAKI